MTPLPEADAQTRAFFEAWLERFSHYVRDVDYASARPLWHPDVVIFGTHQDVVQGRETCIATQWDNVWPRTEGFRFDLARTRVLVSDDGSLATVIAPWTSTGFHPDGARFDRPGRATLVFHRSDADWQVVHSHLSLNRGVPQESHASRQVKAR
ncbi:MAG: nuclear transport factor 2 family protein [Acidisphaera sp.]|nr:nuclear transport factor 2 family protein [Acidisphaera sp.]